MAGTDGYLVSVDAIALAAATAKSVFELATASTARATILEWWVEFDGVSSTAVPVKVEVGTFSAAVTTASSITPGKLDPADGAAASTTKHSTSTEGAGTATTVDIHRVSPTSGLWYVAPMGNELMVPVSSFFRIRLTAPAIVNATFGVKWRE